MSWKIEILTQETAVARNVLVLATLHLSSNMVRGVPILEVSFKKQMLARF
jgi:hypothetical protein